MASSYQCIKLLGSCIAPPDLKYRQRIVEMEYRRDGLSKLGHNDNNTVFTEINKEIVELKVLDTQFKEFENLVAGVTLFLMSLSIILIYYLLSQVWVRTVVMIIIVRIGFAINYLCKSWMIKMCCPRISSPTEYNSSDHYRI